MATSTKAHPAVHAHETDEEFIVEIELPAASAPLQLELDAGRLTVRVRVPHLEQAWTVHPEATGV